MIAEERRETAMGCQHAGCMCEVVEGEQFCSDYCRGHAAETGHGEHVCECGHAACMSVGE